MKYALVVRGKRQTAPPIFAGLHGSGSGLPGQRPLSPRPHSPDASPLSVRHAGCSPALPGVIPPNNGEADRGRGAHPAFPPPLLTLLQVLLVVPGLLFLCGEVLHPGGPPHGPAGGGLQLGAAAARLRAGARGPGQCGGGGPSLPRRGLGLQCPRPRRAPSPSAAGLAPARGWLAAAVWPGWGPAEPGAPGGGCTKGGGARTAGGTVARRAQARPAGLGH